jgi:hypothetical protein
VYTANFGFAQIGSNAAGAAYQIGLVSALTYNTALSAAADAVGCATSSTNHVVT